MRLLLFSLLICLFVGPANAQPSIRYRLNLDNIRHHELKIDVLFENIRKDSLTIRMANTSPGRYAEHNFAKNIYEEQVFTRKGEKLPIKRTSPFTWKIPLEDNFARFSYTLYGNYADGTYTGIDNKKLHLNMPASFVYGEDLQEVPIDLIIDLAAKPAWSVATQLVQTNDSTYSAPDYYYFFDSPTLAGEIDWRSWKVDDQTIEVAMMHEGTDEELDAYVDWIKKLVNEEKAVYGELPAFDYGRYTFLISYNPWVHGDGMEHRNSTICTSSGNLEKHAKSLIGTVAHEFFHAWNIERIRPRSLEPFDFTEANLSGALWFGEGFTSYYDDLVLVRSGIITPQEYVAGLTGMLNYVKNAPGREIRNPIQMSYNAPFVDAATANDETNYPNNFISYYSYGAVLGLVLDLMIRTTFDDLSLDDYMQYVWKHHGEPEQTYTLTDLQKALTVVTKDEAFAKSFFDRYIYDSELPDLETLLSDFGIRIEPVAPENTDLSTLNLDDSGIIMDPVLRNSSLYEAGIERGDKIISLARQYVQSGGDVRQITNTLEPGKSYSIEYEQLGEIVSGAFTAKPNPAFRLILLSDQEIGPDVRNMRNQWLTGD